MNIAPADADVFDPAAYIGQTHVTPPEREALASLESVGLHDVVRDKWPDKRIFTYWDYRAGMFHQDLGMRIDLVLASDPVASRVRAAWVDRQARKGTGPSDHAPVIVDLDEAPDGDIGPVVPPPSARPGARRPARSRRPLARTSDSAGEPAAAVRLASADRRPGPPRPGGRAAIRSPPRSGLRCLAGTGWPRAPGRTRPMSTRTAPAARRAAGPR